MTDLSKHGLSPSRGVDPALHRRSGENAKAISLATAGDLSIGQGDIEAVIKASQALSSELGFGTLIELLMRSAVEHSGAERGLLILLRGDAPWIAAKSSTDHGEVTVAVREAVVSASDLLPSVLHEVLRTRERVGLDDALAERSESEDDYVRQRRPRSVLCLPIVKLTKLVGALYLENNLTPRAFTPDRVAVLEVMASQAAISLENARLYSDLQRENIDRIRVEEALRQARADLAQVSRLTTMGELTASIAHELNQPIAAAVTNADACLRWLAGDNPNLKEARAAAIRIVNDGTRAGEIIRRTRLFFEKGATQSELVNVDDVMRETIVLLRGEAARYAISIRTALAAEPCKVIGDRVQLQQVIMNLVMNSIDAMREVDGERKLTIKSQLTEDRQIMVSISDTGPGIPPERMDQIFDAFFTTKLHGIGMGLSISRSIVEAHAGRLRAAPNMPRGAVFQFSLPAEETIPSA